MGFFLPHQEGTMLKCVCIGLGRRGEKIPRFVNSHSFQMLRGGRRRSCWLIRVASSLSSSSTASSYSSAWSPFAPMASLKPPARWGKDEICGFLGSSSMTSSIASFFFFLVCGFFFFFSPDLYP